MTGRRCRAGGTNFLIARAFLQVVELQASFIEENLLSQVYHSHQSCHEHSLCLAPLTRFTFRQVAVLMPGLSFPIWAVSLLTRGNFFVHCSSKWHQRLGPWTARCKAAS